MDKGLNYKTISESVPAKKDVSPSKEQGQPLQKVLDLDKFCIFRKKEGQDEEIREYLEYIKKVFPNKSSNLGVLMQGEIDESKALGVLHKTGNDSTKAKFLITFPALTRYMRKEGLGVDFRQTDWPKMFDKYVQLNTMMHFKQESTHFEKVLKGLDAGELQMNFQDLSELIMDARSNKFKVPSKVRKLFEESFNGSREIEKILEGNKKIEDLEILTTKVNKFLVKPQNYSRLQEFLEKAKNFEAEVMEILMSTEKNLKIMQIKMNCLKVLNLKSSSGETIYTFKKLWEKTYSYIENVQQIINPYNTKSNQRKSDFGKAKKILEFFVNNGIQDQKISNLSSLIHDTNRLLSVCTLFLEDEEPGNAHFLLETISKLENGKFDMRNLIGRVRVKEEYYRLYNQLEDQWRNENYTRENQSIIAKLLVMKIQFKRGRILQLQVKVQTVERIQ